MIKNLFADDVGTSFVKWMEDGFGLKSIYRVIIIFGVTFLLLGILGLIIRRFVMKEKPKRLRLP